jgi:hypothetical protein
MHFGEDEKPARKAALQKLMSVLGGETSKKLSGLKKGPTSDEPPADLGDDMPAEEPDGDEPSDEEKAKITELYERYCK